MHLAYSSDDWLNLNAQHCNRYHARLTQVGCEENRQKLDASRCTGCDGLEDVQRELERREPVVIHCEPESDDPMTQALAGALQDILNGEDDEELLEDPEAEEFDDETPEDELSGVSHRLLALLEAETEESLSERRPVPEQNSKRRVAVFMGRCPHCKGYMANIIEWYDGIKDDAVYRCYNCGWRTSPKYEQNRQLAATEK